MNSLIRIDVLTGKVYTYTATYPSGNLQYGLLQSMMTITTAGDLYLFGESIKYLRNRPLSYILP